uniref:Amino acid permease/ SLC12A domain-containing protein n=1 Tax=Brassica campestris TaxID=3711 RepID=M4E7U5_BRACM
MQEIDLGIHTIRSHGGGLASKHNHDWIILVILVAIEIGLQIISPFYIYVVKDMMTDLKYPFNDNTIPVWSVPIYAVLLPIIIFVCFYMKRTCVYILGLLFTVLITGFITDSIKLATGRPRPNFYWRERAVRCFRWCGMPWTCDSRVTGITTTYNTGLRFGGTVTLVYGWFVAGVFTMCVGLSMAEICSSYPTSGGLYYWSAMLAGPRWAPLASWLTGWFNIVGQLIQVIVLLSTGGKDGGGYEGSDYVVIAIHGGILFIHALLNSPPISVLSFIGQLAALWNLLGVLVLMILIPVVSTERATTKFVFTNFNTDNGLGITSYAYIFVLGLLMSQYTITGYDASAHMTEETIDADKNGARGIISAIGISILFGWGYIRGISYAVPDIPYLLSETNNSGGYAIAEIFYLAFKSRSGSGTGGIVCLGIVAVAVFFCGMSSVTSSSRMAYAFSRDGAMPFSPLWHKVNSREVPVNAVWLSASISFFTGEYSGVPRNGVHSNDLTVHSIRNTDLSKSDAVTQNLCGWTIQPRGVRKGGRLGGSHMGCNHLRPLLTSRGISHNGPPLVYRPRLQHS